MNIETFITRFEQGLANVTHSAPAESRQRYDQLCETFAPSDPHGMRITDETRGCVTLRHFIPAPAKPGRVMYLHGGGFTLGSINSHHGIAASLANQLTRHVVSLDYRLAPEADYSDMLGDCINAAHNMAPIAIVGDSAGGRLALDLLPRLPHSVPLGLIYPPVGPLNPQTLGPDAPLLSRNDVLSLTPFCPGLSTHVDTLPPTAQLEVLSVEHDPLTSPLEQAVAAWRRNGAQVGYRRANTMVHAALHAHALLPEMQSAWQDFCQALNRRLDH
ncbi:alpha/beta hydrolase [Halomonas sp. 7T]|jgi:acetyl esterase|uniref:alpha/beta hydrolase n=1 Tax=Halomonas sp. 7T TaxID=2893469 RepID=UPI0021D92B8F|nr:alpha/beta hydrolase [Halomonas sp. 7T]UXZ55131.1 alpha/beta hydrolase [Halomonas sp. 7T]